MKIVVDIQDKQATFAMEVLRSLSFVRQAKAMSLSGVKLWKDLIEATNEVKLHKYGKIKSKTAQELLNEL